LAEKNQQISTITRQLENYPTRAELLQYEKRFVELYKLTNERLKETKKYYHLYNSLNDVHDTIKTEVKLLEQIKDEFSKRTKTSQDREDFLKSLEKILKNLDEMLNNTNEKCKNVKSEKDDKTNEYNELLNQQRKYFILVKDFENQSKINQELTDKLENLESQLKNLNE